MKKKTPLIYYTGCLWIMVICIIVSYFLERNDLMILCVAGMVATDMCINSEILELEREKLYDDYDLSKLHIRKEKQNE